MIYGGNTVIEVDPANQKIASRYGTLPSQRLVHSSLRKDRALPGGTGE
jgi:hypothetical protein